MCFLFSETIQETGSHKLHVKLFILVMSSYMLLSQLSTVITAVGKRLQMFF